MPIYEYRCEACQHELEALQKMSDEPLKVCPQCGASALQKQVSAAGFRLKGGGWYETDFKSGGKKNVAEASASPSDAAPASCPAGGCAGGPCQPDF
ncbi:MAG TPA: FmdB family zinc ribbon protein [Spongiibacteraceae bacterium]|nr:FmdB family zinc ribbon protein [Spongiibacteraceae bacterium]